MFKMDYTLDRDRLIGRDGETIIADLSGCSIEERHSMLAALNAELDEKLQNMMTEWQIPNMYYAEFMHDMWENIRHTILEQDFDDNEDFEKTMDWVKTGLEQMIIKAELIVRDDRENRDQQEPSY